MGRKAAVNLKIISSMFHSWYMLAQIDRAVGDVGGEGEAVIVEGVGLSGYRAEEDAVFSAAGV